MLKATITIEQYTGLEESHQNLYKKTGEVYLLQVDGMVSNEKYNEKKDKLDEFRENNINLNKKYSGIDLDEIKELQAQKRKLLDNEFIDKKDFDGLVDSRTNVIKADFDAKLLTLSSQLEDSTAKYNGLISKTEIDGAINSALAKNKINPDAFEAVMAQARNKFSIENGVAVAKDGDNIIAGKNGNLTIDEYVSTMPEVFKIQSNGGRGHGGGGNPNEGGNSARGVDQISAGLKELGMN